MNKKGQSREVIKLIVAILIFIFIGIPVLNVLNNPEKLLALLPGLVILAIFFDIIRRLFRL